MKLIEAPAEIIHKAWETGKWMHGHPKTSFLGATALCGLLSFGGFHHAGEQSNAESAWVNQAQNTTLLVDTNQYAAHQFAIRADRAEHNHNVDAEIQAKNREISALTRVSALQNQVIFAESRARAIGSERDTSIGIGLGTGDASGIFGGILFLKFFIDWADRDFNRNRH
jgi:hypothetical protein